MMDLKGKTVIVSGGAEGIGFERAKASPLLAGVLHEKIPEFG